MERLLIVVVMGKRLEQQNTVEALNGDRNALKLLLLLLLLLLSASLYVSKRGAY